MALFSASTIASSTVQNNTQTCYHCGEINPNQHLHIADKYFCCQGCMSVFSLLNQAGLCSYYDLNPNAGINKRQEVRQNKFAYLEDTGIVQSLISFQDDAHTHITFYIPFIHCSSCVYLLERLYLLDSGVKRVDLQFLKKEVQLIFNHKEISLRGVVELLSSIGYEPHISLQQLSKKKPVIRKQLVYRLGVAGFCFGNIMLLSFPEYFSNQVHQEAYLGNLFRYISLFLSLPVFFYSSMEFFQAAWKGFKHQYLNIDAPVSLAIIVCFVRSLIDILGNTGPGFLESMSGIVFFMLIGRLLQERTYGQLSFERDYTDYFPIAATVIADEEQVPTPLPKIKVNDTLLIHNNELVPADGIIVKGQAQIDYSFVTGESTPVTKSIGSIVYAGGKQLGADMEILTIKEVAQSYLTNLWNKHKAIHKNDDLIFKQASIHIIAKYFTWVVLAIAILAGVYWSFVNPVKVWPAVTAVLIVACPCALLLTSTFCNGYLLRILEKNGLFVRNANLIEPFGQIDTLVFDKTGTLTASSQIEATYHGELLTTAHKQWLASVTIPSLHALAKPVQRLLQVKEALPVTQFKEYAGLGVEGVVEGHHIAIGTATHLHISDPALLANQGTCLFVKMDGVYMGYFELRQGLREGVQHMFAAMSRHMHCILLSGDQSYQQAYLQKHLGAQITMKFQQSPEDKLEYIKYLQAQGRKVAMIGDGLNDAGALMQSDIGICIAEDTNTFTPAGDAILEGKKMGALHKFFRLAANAKLIIRTCFVFSVVYNLIGIFFAVQGLLSPLMAAVLMPCSTLTIVLITYFTSKGLAGKYGLD